MVSPFRSRSRSRSVERNSRHSSEQHRRRRDDRHHSRQSSDVKSSRLHRDYERSDRSKRDGYSRESVRKSSHSHYKDPHKFARDEYPHQSGSRSQSHNHNTNKEEEFMDVRRQERERIGLYGVPQVWAKSPANSGRYFCHLKI